MRRDLTWFNLTALALGLAFLYLPLAVIMIYSFNSSEYVNIWGGWSLRWYEALARNNELIDATLLSFGIATVSATVATILGTLSAVALVRFGPFPGRTLFSGMIYAPLVMPEVITALSLLLMFVAMAQERGFWTVAIAHATVTLCFVAVVVQARLLSFDESLEEAAMDLGCPPLRTFLTVTLPLIWPALAAGWILAFTLSLDDYVIASFTGSGTKTLPIYIYSQVRLGVKPEVNAICTVLIALIAMVVIAASLLFKRSQIAAAQEAGRR